MSTTTRSAVFVRLPVSKRKVTEQVALGGLRLHGQAEAKKMQQANCYGQVQKDQVNKNTSG